MPDSSQTLLAQSPYMAERRARYCGWRSSAGGPDQALSAALAEIAVAGRAAADEAEIGRVLRVAKARIALLSATAEVTGQWTTAQSTAALADLADAALEAGLDVLMRG